MADCLIELPASLGTSRGSQKKPSWSRSERDRIDVWWNLATDARRTTNQARQMTRSFFRLTGPTTL